MLLVDKLVAQLTDEMPECDACCKFIKMDFYIPPALLDYQLTRRYAQIDFSATIQEDLVNKWLHILVPHIRPYLYDFGQDDLERQYIQQLFAEHSQFWLEVGLAVVLLTQLLVLADSKHGVQNKVPGFVAFQNFFRVFVAYLKYFPEHMFEQLDVWGKIRDPIFVPPIFLNAVSSRHYLQVFYSTKNFAFAYPLFFTVFVLAEHIVLVIVKFFFKLQNV